LCSPLLLFINRYHEMKLCRNSTNMRNHISIESSCWPWAANTSIPWRLSVLWGQHLARPILWFRRSDAGSDRPNHLFWLKISSVVDCCCYFVVRIWKQGWFGLAIVYSNREIEFNYYLISSGSDISITKSGARAVQTCQTGSDVWMFWGFGRMTSHNIWTICEDY
jgi:hypothetical protein